MSNTKQLLRQLKDRDPQKRIYAIKRLAKAKERAALEPLARMAGDDKDANVREMARKAGAYILQETGGLETSNGDKPPERRVDKKGKPIKVAVDEDEQARAEALMNDAMSLIMNQQVSKAMKVLSKALAINPNLQYESYFMSLAEQASGAEGTDAIDQLYDDKLRANIDNQQAAERRQKRLQEHAETTSQASWKDVGFDLALFAVLTTMMVLIVGILTVQSARNYVDKVDTNRANARQASSLGQFRINPDDDTDIRYWVDRNEEGPIWFKEMTPDWGFYNTAEDIGEIDVLVIFGVSLGAGIVSALLLALMGEITHVVSAKVLRGVGTPTYLMHNVTGIFINRAVLLGFIAGVASIIVFNAGGGLVLQIFGGVLALVVVFSVLKVVMTVGNAYDFGFAKGMIATSAGSAVIAGIVGMGAIFVV